MQDAFTVLVSLHEVCFTGEVTKMNSRKNTILSIVGTMFCYILFVVSMLNVEQNAFLTLFKIIGLSGTSYFVFRMVTRALENKK